MQSDIRAQWIDGLVVFVLEIHDAVLAEGGDADAGFRIQRDHLISGSDVDDAFRAAVGPIRQAAAGKLARRNSAALALVFAMHPEKLSSGRVERHDGSPRSGGRIEHALDHQRRAFEVGFGARTEIVGLEAPGDFQFVEIPRVDLVERGVPGVAQIAAIGGPFAVFRSGLRQQGRYRYKQNYKGSLHPVFPRR